MTINVAEHKPGTCDFSRLEWIDQNRLCMVLDHAAEFRKDEGLIAKQQHGIITDYGFEMPSPWGDGADVCRVSWFHEFQFYYLFYSQIGEPYFWITGLLDRAYSLDTLWFPSRDQSFTIHPSQMDGSRLTRFLDHYPDYLDKFSNIDLSAQVRCFAIFGFPHFMHTLWNELPAIIRASHLSLGSEFRLGLLLQPFGPMETICPTLKHQIEHLRFSDLSSINRSCAMLVGLGSSTIEAEVQTRIQKASYLIEPDASRQNRERIVSKFKHLFWISVKPPNRTLKDQSQFIYLLVNNLSEVFEDAGFILNGASKPWDFDQNPNYDQAFKERHYKAAKESGNIAKNILDDLSEECRSKVIVLNDIAIEEEISWAMCASFYICHGGTMQNKIGWTTDVPGVVHSSTDFLASLLYTEYPAKGTSVFEVPVSMIIDDEEQQYSPLELARKDRNYSFKDAHAAVSYICDVYQLVLLRKRNKFVELVC